MEAPKMVEEAGRISARIVAFIGDNTIGRLAGTYPPHEEEPYQPDYQDPKRYVPRDWIAEEPPQQ